MHRWQQSFADRFNRFVDRRYRVFLDVCIQNRYITLVEYRDGLMTRFREFYDSQATAAAFGPLLDPEH